jgi:hypothetical protein
MRYEVEGIIKKWHYEMVDGQQIRVVDEAQITQVSLIPDTKSRLTPAASDRAESARCPNCGGKMMLMCSRCDFPKPPCG